MPRKPAVAPGWCSLTGKQEQLLVAISEDGILTATKDDKTGWTTYSLKQDGRTHDCKESDVYALVRHKLVKDHPQDARFLVVKFTPTPAGMTRAALCVGKKGRG